MSCFSKDIKRLGFGMMRLPKQGDEFDIPQICEMVDAFMEAGCSYYDTAWTYDGSEEATRKALIDRYPRESYQFATKMSAWKVDTAEESKVQLEVSLERTGLEYFDYYLMHNLGADRTANYDRFGIWDFLKEKQKEGVFRHLGISWHDRSEPLDRLLTEHPEIEFVQLQVNYADWNFDVIDACSNYETVLRHGKDIVVMEPVKGGMLATPPEEVAEVFRALDPELSMSARAIRFVLGLEGVNVCLSGMSSIEQMRDNLKTLQGFSGLSAEEEAAYVRAREILFRYPLIPCTGCDYCGQQCPMNIGISGYFRALNELTLYRNRPQAVRRYGITHGLFGKAAAGECVDCGACEAACPQSLPVRELLKDVVKEFES